MSFTTKRNWFQFCFIIFAVLLGKIESEGWWRSCDFFFQNGGHRHLRFLNFQKFNGRKGDDCKDAAFHLLCIKAEVSEYRKAYWFLVVIMARLVTTYKIYKVHRCRIRHNKKPFFQLRNKYLTRMWANAQRDGRPAEHRWRPLFNAAMFGWHPLLDAVQ